MPLLCDTWMARRKFTMFELQEIKFIAALFSLLFANVNGIAVGRFEWISISTIFKHANQANFFSPFPLKFIAYWICRHGKFNSEFAFSNKQMRYFFLQILPRIKERKGKKSNARHDDIQFWNAIFWWLHSISRISSGGFPARINHAITSFFQRIICGV